MTDIDIKKLSEIVRKEITQALKLIENRFDGVEKRLDNFQSRLDGLEQRVDRMEVRLDATFEEVGKILVKLTRLEDDSIIIKNEFQYIRRTLRLQEKTFHMMVDVYDNQKETLKMLVERVTWIEEQLAPKN